MFIIKIQGTLDSSWNFSYDCISVFIMKSTFINSYQPFPTFSAATQPIRLVNLNFYNKKFKAEQKCILSS